MPNTHELKGSAQVEHPAERRCHRGQTGKLCKAVIMCSAKTQPCAPADPSK